MEKYITEKDGKKITIWNANKEIGLRFIEGETLQRHLAEIMVSPDITKYGTEEGLTEISSAVLALQRYAVEHYPKEFSPILD